MSGAAGDNGIATHEWRIRYLETRMEKIEGRINYALYLLVANLGGIVLLLGQKLFLGK